MAASKIRFTILYSVLYIFLGGGKGDTRRARESRKLLEERDTTNGTETNFREKDRRDKDRGERDRNGGGRRRSRSRERDGRRFDFRLYSEWLFFSEIIGKNEAAVVEDTGAALLLLRVMRQVLGHMEGMAVKTIVAVDGIAMQEVMEMAVIVIAGVGVDINMLLFHPIFSKP